MTSFFMGARAMEGKRQQTEKASNNYKLTWMSIDLILFKIILKQSYILGSKFSTLHFLFSADINCLQLRKERLSMVKNSTEARPNDIMIAFTTKTVYLIN